ncbi:MAG: hypothetical protein GXO90_08125 [FCB group bacterium]|nr:hypothetical protein [FCB group bacterium]
MRKQRRLLWIVLIGSFLCCQDDPVTGDQNTYNPPDEHVLSLPTRSSDALSGSTLVSILTPLSLRQREARILTEILSGNIPDFLRQLVPVTMSAALNGSPVTVTFYATCDYLALGSDEDYFLIPMTPILAQELADSLDMSLMTRKMVDTLWQQADLKLEPRPIPPSAAMVTIPVFAEHNELVHTQRFQDISNYPLGILVAGHKKDVILSNRIITNQNKVVIYGWHQLNGQPIQPLYSGHVNWYADYSHGIRLVRRRIRVDDQNKDIGDILSDPAIYKLLSDEDGPMLMPRYPVDKSSYP